MIQTFVPAAAAILVLSEPMTRLVYQRGEFDAQQTQVVAEALAEGVADDGLAGVVGDGDGGLVVLGDGADLVQGVLE